MHQPLRILLVDSESDAAIRHHLEEAGLRVNIERVETAGEMRAALAQKPCDVVIAADRLDRFDAFAALSLLHETGTDIPFLVVCATPGEELAVALMKAGANDYLRTENLERIAQAVGSEIEAAEIRRARARTEEIHPQSEAMFRAVAESALVAILAVDDAGVVKLWNAAAEAMFGRSAAEALDRSLPDLVAPSDPAACQAWYAVLCRPEQGELPPTRTLEMLARKSGGTEFPVLMTVATIRCSGPFHAVVLVRDINWRKQVESALRDSEHRWQFALEGAGDGVWDWNGETDTTYYSRQWKRMIGYGEDEIGDRREEFDDRVHPEDRQRIHEALARHFSGDVPTYSCEYRLRCKDGSYKWILGRGKVIGCRADGSPIRVIGTHTDISALKAAEAEREKLRAQLQQVQKMESIGRLAGGVAHDFNNLLTVINGYSNQLLEQMGPADPLRDSIGEISRAGQRAAELVHRLLAFGRRQVLREQMLDVNGLVGDLHRMLQPLLGDDVEVVTRLRPNLSAVRADRHQLEQAIMNLAVNARGAMPHGGCLTIVTDECFQRGNCQQCQSEIRPANYVRISVADTGGGIDENIRPHIFEPFFTTKETGKGTGLGLAMVQGIVMQSGGHVSFESVAGQGSTFHIFLPAVVHTVAAQPAAVIPAALPTGTETILLVEDQADVRRFIVRLLRRCGYRVLAAAGGEEALAGMQNNTVDLLITDLVMPGMSGRDLACRALAVRPRLKVLFLSGYSAGMLAGTEDAVAAPALIQKPFDPRVLAARIRDVLGPQPTARAHSGGG